MSYPRVRAAKCVLSIGQVDRRFQTQLERSDDSTIGNMKNTSSPLKAFKRATSVELSKWYTGSPTTNLAEKQDTDAALRFRRLPM